MASFTPVSGGTPTNAADINQLINALNATTGAQVLVVSPSNASHAIAGYLPSSPGSDIATVGSAVTADAQWRASLYISSTGYGGVLVGNGTSIVGHIVGITGGVRVTENLTVGGTLTVSSTTSLAGTTITGTLSVSSTASLGANSTVGGNKIPGLIGGGTKISVQNSAPGSPSTGDIWINTATNLG